MDKKIGTTESIKILPFNKSSFIIFRNYLHTHMPTYLPTHIPTYFLPTYLPTYYLPTYLPICSFTSSSKKKVSSKSRVLTHLFNAVSCCVSGKQKYLKWKRIIFKRKMFIAEPCPLRLLCVSVNKIG